MDIGSVSDAELRQLKRMIDGELSRRETLATAEKRAADLNAEFLAAAGVTDGDVWRQPTSAVDAYPKDWTVQHNDKTWVSLIAANVWEPPTAWREVVEEGETPEWVQPTGATDAYNKGDRVSYNGKVYESVIDGNVWSVDEYPAGWSLIG